METFYYSSTINRIGIELADNTLGDKIKYSRLVNNMYQKDLALKLGVHVTTIIRYEQNKIIPSAKMLKQLEVILNISLY